MVVFRLNNTAVSNPINWQDFGIRIFREDDINGLFIEFTTDLEFNGDGYRLIRDVFNNSLGCDLIDVEVIYYCDGVPRKLLDGYIIISECRFDLQRCIVKTKVFDNNFSSRINTNKAIVADAYLTETKNGEGLAPINEITTQMFNPSTGILATDRRIPSVFVFDYLKHLISFMSDNTVTLVSSVFDVGGEYFGLTLTSGLSIRTNKKAPIVTSFTKLFEALHKKINLSLYAKGSVLYIEKRDDVYLSGQSIQIDNIRDLTQFIDKEKLASAVNVGSEPVFQEWECNNGQGCSNPQVRGFGFQEDQFGFKGVCNIDSVRDLKSSDIVFDTNVIEDVLRYNNESYDRNVFIIDTVATLQPTNRAAIASNPFGIGTFFFYNGRLTNDNVIQNYANDLPNVIGDYYEPIGTIGATGLIINDTLIVDVLQIYDPFDPVLNFTNFYSEQFNEFLRFNDIISGNNFDNVLYKYTATFAGIYTFRIRQYFNAVGLGNPSNALGNLTLFAKRLSFNEDLIETFESSTAVIYGSINANSFLELNFTTFLNIGDTLAADFGASVSFPGTFPGLIRLNVLATTDGGVNRSTFEIVSADEIIVTPPTINPENFNRIKYEFERPLDYSDVVELMDNPEKIVRITHPKLPGGRNCFIDEVVIQNLGKFETKFNLISNK